MRVQDLQLFLSNFTKGSDAVKNAVIYVEIKGKLHAIRRMEVHENAHPIIGFSKTYDDDFNPQSEFVAILTCSSADKGCPFIAGAEKRIPITFEDPKAFDNTPQQVEKYNERSIQIATELMYVFSQIKL